MACEHFGPGDVRNSWALPGPWFESSYPGECSRGGEEFEQGTRIRADGQGSWECEDCVIEDEPEDDEEEDQLFQ